MEMSSQEFKVKCPKGNVAFSSCARPQCKKAPLMCENKECECKQSHETCLSLLILSNLQTCLEKKGRSYHPVLKTIYKWYEAQAKLIQIQLRELDKMIENSQPKLKGDQKDLYSYLIEGKENLIVSSLVARVADSIFGEPCYSIQPKLEKIGEVLSDHQTQLAKIIEQVRTISNYSLIFPTLQTSHFTKQLSHSNVHVIDNHTVRLQTNSGKFHAALVSTSIKGREYKSFNYQFKWNKAGADIMIGVCQLIPGIDAKTLNLYGSLQYGSFTYPHGKNMCLGSVVGHRTQKTNLYLVQASDIVEVEYHTETQKVIVKNITKGTQSVSYIKTDSQYPLHAGALLYNQSDEIQLLKVTYIE